MEWRREALRSYLPEELAAAVKRWREYFQAVAAGGYRPYLQRLYLYELSLDLHERWEAVSEEVRSARRRTNAWALRPALVELCDRIEQLPPPTLQPAPLWVYWRSVPSVDEGVQPEIQKWSQYDNDLVELTRSFDAKVPGNWKVRCYSTFPTLPAFALSGLEDTYLQEYLAWLEECCAAGCVLLLDY
jgi:hypothetical protein